MGGENEKRKEKYGKIRERIWIEEMEVIEEPKIVGLLWIKVKIIGSYPYLRCYVFFSNLNEFLKLCSKIFGFF